MNRPSEWGRRTYLRGLAAAGIVGSVPVAASAAHDYDDERGPPDDDERGPPHDDDRDPHELPDARPFIGDLDGLNADLDDGVGDMAFHVKNRYHGDPDPDADPDDRTWPLHYTTEGVETQDYPSAMINIHERLDKTVKLRDLHRDGEHVGKLAFDYFAGPKHDQYIPGQVYLVIQTKAHKDQAEEGEEERVAGLYKNVRKGEDYRGAWHTLDVVAEMAGEGTDDGWHLLSLPKDPDGFRAEHSFDAIADAVLQQAILTRDRGPQIDDIFDEWHEDGELLAFGLGSGSSRTPTVRDIYYDDYRLHVKDQEHSFDIPAALEIDGDVRRNGQIIAKFSLPPDQENVDLADVDEDSIRLYPFSQIAPPHSEGAAPARVIVSDDEIEARFPPGRARDLPGLSGGDRWVTVAGKFDYEHGVWFFGSGQVRIPGN